MECYDRKKSNNWGAYFIGDDIKTHTHLTSTAIVADVAVMTNIMYKHSVPLNF